MEDILEKAVNRAQELGAEYADIRIDDVSRTGLEVKDGSAECVGTGSSIGAGVRVLKSGVWGFASTSSIDGLADAVKRALALARASSTARKQEPFRLADARTVKDRVMQRVRIHPRDVSVEYKMGLLKAADKTAREASSKVSSTRVIYRDAYGDSWFANTDGSMIRTSHVYGIMFYFVTAREGGRIEESLKRVGSFSGLEQFSGGVNESQAARAAKEAVALLKAEKSPRGKMRVIVAPRIAGLFAHEAVGHASEADSVLAKASVLAGAIGKKLASEDVTIVDDGSLAGLHGSFKYDDEGVRSRRTEIIYRGVMNAYLQSRETAGRQGQGLTGNGRAQSYAFRPLVRMSNTFFDKGSMHEDEIEDIKEGIFVSGFMGGEVSVTEGNFTFGIRRGYVIKNGERTRFVKGVSLSGNIFDVLKSIDGVTKKIDLNDIGFCGKDGQRVPVTDGGPRVRATMLVGG